ncbi:MULTISPECIES: helix-turn-helix transcriptional regulator [unclassified Schaalia]|uniref:helix-turn-helix transcriptional regulator n=1 Tax=unclassified Schaalia TaxID=2691889 RepID=UPI001E305A41|nr:MULTISPECIES: transcriptional regulator [unclassified Schaalia]MCD4550358.1 transcriptional regulator [Schaalia sp. lx-260]MCD4556925.1 transcriptional regulator [Schaalia sp. lx-100]
MAEHTDACTREQVLDLVVEKGPVTASVIARVLGLTTAAVRRHITILLDGDEIAEHDPRHQSKRGRGRPARHYVATERAHERLTDAYSEIAVKALGYLGQVGGEEAVESFAAARSREIERRYAPIVRDAGNDPRVRAQALADALTQDGYAATVRDIGGGGFAIQLCQGHCPIQQVAGDYPQLCDAETQAFSRLLSVHVQRLATLAGGEHVCTTHIPVNTPLMRSSARTVLRK